MCTILLKKFSDTSMGLQIENVELKRLIPFFFFKLLKVAERTKD